MTLYQYFCGQFSVGFRVGGALCVLSACSAPSPAQESLPQAQQRLVHSAKVVPPTVSAEAVIAGHPIVVSCASTVGADGEEPRSAAVPVVSPSVAPIGQDGDAVTFAPKTAGTYATQCINHRDGTYAAGPTFEVLPGSARTVTAAVSPSAVNAGESIAVSCVGTDAFGNVVPMLEYSALGGPGVSFFINGALVDLDDQGRLPIDSRQTQDAVVQCQAVQWPHLPVSAPITVDVTPSVLVGLHADVDAMFYAAHEPVAVRCTGIDSFGKKRDVPSAVVHVIEDGAVTNGQTFFADKVGDYRALCSTAESHQDDGTVMPALTSAPTTVSIAAGAPAQFAVRFHASGVCLSQTTPLPLTWRLYDAYHNALSGYDVSLTTDPPTPLTRNAVGGFTIAQSGSYTLKLKPVGLPGAERVEPWIHAIVVNSTPPQIVITSPERAGTVQSDEPNVMLKGYVQSAHGPLDEVNINGVKLPGARGQQTFGFEVPYTATWGLNIVHGHATDACGNEAVLMQSFLHSGTFGPAATVADEKARVPHSVRARFGQATWDDGDPNTLQDVATLMQMALQSSSLEDRLPHRLGAYPKETATGELPSGRMGLSKPFAGKVNGVEVFRDGPLQIRDPRIEYITAADGGWDVAFSLQDLAVPFEVKQYMHWGMMGSSVLFTAKGALTTARMRVGAHIGVVMRDGLPQANIDEKDLHVTFAEGVPQLNMGAPSQSSWFGDFVQNHILSHFRQLPANLVPVIEERVRKEIVSQMDIFLEGLELHHSLPLPPPFETNLQVISGLDSIDMHGPKGAGYGDFGLFAQIVAPDVTVVPPAHAPFAARPLQRGPIRRSPVAAMPLNLDEGQSFALAVHDDLLNQMLWALWAGGTLNRKLPPASTAQLKEQNRSSAEESDKQPPSSESLLEAADFEVFLLSPPVVMPSDTDNEMVLGLGDAWARADLATGRPDEPHMQISFFFSAILKAHIEIDPEQGHLVLKPQTPLDLHLEVNAFKPAALSGTAQRWMDKKLRDWVPGYLTDTLRSFPLPTLTIGRIPGVPEDAVWVPDNGTIERPAYGAETVVQGTLRGARAKSPKKPGK